MPPLLACIAALVPVQAHATGLRASIPAALGAVNPVLPAADAGRARSCDPRTDCPGRRPPGPPDRDARPFDGTLGRPCGYRWRFTPSGTRRVRVCF